MGHHHHNHDHSTGNIKVAFFLNLGFTVIEIIGGLYTGSLAILSDALHDLGDSLSIGLSWYFQKLSSKKKDKKYSYGYKRFSVLGALVNAVILLIGSVFIISEAVPTLMDPKAVNEQGMLWIAVFGVVVNGAAALRLKRGTSLNEKVISLHLIEDVLGWVAVLIGSLLIMYFDWFFIDPLLSVMISIFIIYNVIKNLRASLGVILQSTPQNIEVDMVQDRLMKLEAVVDIHDCHIWSMDGEYNVLTAHIVLNKGYEFTDLEQIKRTIKAELRALKIEHSTLEFEQLGEDCQDC